MLNNTVFIKLKQLLQAKLLYYIFLGWLLGYGAQW